VLYIADRNATAWRCLRQADRILLIADLDNDPRPDAAERDIAEAGIPIDHVAGTSLGANIAAQHAMGWSPDHMIRANRRIGIDIAPQRKYTLPLVSVLAERKSAVCARMMYDDFDMEDTWIP
jgi:hypothetical protein